MTWKNNRRRNKMLLFIAAFSLLPLLILVPFNLIISENRTFQIVDSNLNFIANCSIDHEWIQYALDVREEDQVFSDDKGFVVLPQRKVRTSLLELIKGAHAKLQKYGLHASYGSHDVIFIKSDGYEARVIFDGDEIKNGKVVLERKKPR